MILIYAVIHLVEEGNGLKAHHVDYQWAHGFLMGLLNFTIELLRHLDNEFYSKTHNLLLFLKIILIQTDNTTNFLSPGGTTGIR